MAESFDLDQYFSHLRARWRVIALACVSALLLTSAVSLLLPKRYTATARLVIEPPAGSDVRASVAVSPIYLESLRTYEHFALSDDLFRRAFERFDLGDEAPGRSLESWQSSVLQVAIPRNTKVLEINVTLGNPEQAHAMAGFIADETVRLSREINRGGDEEMVENAERQLAEARAARDAAETEWSKALGERPVEALESEIESLERRQARLEQQQSLGEGGAAGREMNELRRQLEEKYGQLARRRARAQDLEARRQTASDVYATVWKRTEEIKSTVGYRGERLKVLDRGVVPERPSGPNTPLHVLSALLCALALSTAYATYDFSRGRRRRAPLAVPIRGTGTHGDD